MHYPPVRQVSRFLIPSGTLRLVLLGNECLTATGIVEWGNGFKSVDVLAAIRSRYVIFRRATHQADGATEDSPR